MLRTYRIKVFTDRFPWLGPFIWILSAEYFIVQFIVARAWHSPYSWRFNTISDLGSTVCDYVGNRPVCSPLHTLMNASFITLGIIIATGSLLIYQEFREDPYTLFGFSLMGIAGLGAVLVGLFPENINEQFHLLGASMPFIFGNFSLLVLSIALYRISTFLRAITFAAGAVALVSLYFLLSQHYGYLGSGGTERLVAYPQTLWLIAFGLYMSRNHILYSRPAQRVRRMFAIANSAARHITSKAK
jgi:hypothetical membrane protein